MALLRYLRCDWHRNPETLTRLVLAVFRLGCWARTRPAWRVPYRILNLLVVRTVVGADLAPSEVGPGLRLHHAGQGVCLHRRARLGADVTLFQDVAIGTTDGVTAPTLGDSVYVGAGAKVIGDVTVGDGARIGANATVVRDVPAGRTAVGPVATIRD